MLRSLSDQSHYKLLPVVCIFFPLFTQLSLVAMFWICSVNILNTLCSTYTQTEKLIKVKLIWRLCLLYFFWIMLQSLVGKSSRGVSETGHVEETGSALGHESTLVFCWVSLEPPTCSLRFRALCMKHSWKKFGKIYWISSAPILEATSLALSEAANPNTFDLLSFTTYKAKEKEITC